MSTLDLDDIEAIENDIRNNLRYNPEPVDTIRLTV
jgi:hypothetical protein